MLVDALVAPKVAWICEIITIAIRKLSPLAQGGSQGFFEAVISKPKACPDEQDNPATEPLPLF